MKSYILKLAGLVTFLLLQIATDATAQSLNRQAKRWLEVGLTERDPQKKIAAFTKALELEPNFVEAKYRLGLLYKAEKNYSAAERHLREAIALIKKEEQGELRFNLLLELARLYGWLGDLEKQETALREAKASAALPEARATIMFELSRLLFKQARYDETLIELRQGREWDRASRIYFDNMIQITEHAIVSRDSAEKTLHGNVANLARNTGAGSQPANVTERVAASANENLQAPAWEYLYQQARAYESEESFELARNIYASLQAEAGGYKESAIKLAEVEKRIEQKRREETLQGEYAAGLAAAHARNWATALRAFENVSQLEPNYLDTAARLHRAQQAFERESRESVVARFYVKGVQALNQGEIETAIKTFETLNKLQPEYRDVAQLLTEAREVDELPNIAGANVAVKPDLEALYQEALLWSQRKEWFEAVVAFEKITTLQPSYRDTPILLAQAWKNLQTETEVKEQAHAAPKTGELQYIILMLGVIVFAAFIISLRFRGSKKKPQNSTSVVGSVR